MKSILILFTLIPSLAFAGELADLFKKQGSNRTEGYNQSQSYDEISSDKPDITEIGLERTLCYGTCPAYSVIIKSDGTFKYTGHKFVDRLGNYTGSVSKWELRTLLQFINDSNYNFFKNSYFTGVTDHPTVYTMVKMNGKTKVISNYANSGPTKLWAIEQLIDKLLLEAKWDQKK